MSTPSGTAWRLRCDGGARGNPGPAASAFILTDGIGNEIEARGDYLGSVTNNVAEYRALISGLESAVRHGATVLEVSMDSELVVRQMTGQYRVKHQGLKPLHALARAAASKIGRVTFNSVRREDNTRADQLVNDTLDRVLGTESPR